MVAAPTRVSPLAMLLGAILLLSSHVLAASAVMGVDLGTEYIKAALVKPGVPLDIILTKDSRRKETSAVVFKPSNGGSGSNVGQYPERLYGSDAMALVARFPGEVYPNLKTLLGLPVNDPTVREYAARHPALQLEANPTRGTAQFKSSSVAAEEDSWTVEELLAMQLQNIQKNAEAAAGDGSSVRSIVLTVPPFYTAEEKRAVQAAAKLAGLNVLSLVSDGLAVGLNYATSRQFPNINDGAKPEYHMVFDMGAGSTKASVIKFQSRKVKDVGKFNKTVQEAQVMGAGWDRTLGGDALNYLIVDDMISQFLESKGAKKISATEAGIRAHGRAMAKLNKDAERVRHVLSANQNTQASFEGLYEDVDFKYKVSRTEFEAMAEAYVDRINVAVQDALKMSGLDIADLDSVILHGGATRTPFVQKALEKTFGSADKLRSNVNSDEAAAFGAGFRAAGLSPSFRVKDIRISEGASYAAGMKWTAAGSGKEQTQRLWSPISPLGGPAKEYTFTEDKDLTLTFFQQIGDVKKDIKAISTKNLTATIAFIKEKHPSCVESGVFFRLGAKLSGEDGEVQIVKAAAECEAEAKEGFVDGVKNLFGFGKKDQEHLEDSTETETVVGSEDKPGESSTATSSSKADATKSSTADAAKSSTTAGSTEEAKKTETVSIPIEFTVEKLGTPELSKEQHIKAKDRLKAFAASDKARIQREEALNQLEGFTYKIRDLLEDEAFVAVSTETERTKLAEKSSAAGEWLYEDGSDATKDEFKAKLKELQDLVTPIQKRKDEGSQRPEQVKQLKEVLSRTSELVGKMRKNIDDYEEWHAKTAAASETPAASDDDALEDDAAADKDESGPVLPGYTREDIKSLEDIAKTTELWLEDLEVKQDALPATANPVLLVQEIVTRRQDIELATKNIVLKGATAKKNSSKKSSSTKGGKSSGSGSKKGSSKTSSANPSGETIKVGDRTYTPEELEEWINNMTEDDWKKVEEDAAKQKAQNHDEL
ncbi:hypoxia up-regulated 1 [Geosmithia morbida]|uniref:Hypoxia up-regulated 1 n=1 Tax=Geosmithia morbida TaxID=1094350 RepID=A0A9P4Z1G6_9HYPO|nr:hypoxia up-regulated 1 [Geosmithia morbida]KAF4126387.1 hypoxia up-regulated 1 [Geosmithia morbida]